MKICALEPDKMPIISTGKIIKQHKIEGIGDDFVPELLDKEKIDKIVLVNDDDSVNMSRTLAIDLGLWCWYIIWCKFNWCCYFE